MAGTINYTHDPEQVVWVIAVCAGGTLAVRKGIVHSVRALVLTPPAVGTVEYNIILTDETRTTFFAEDDTFVDLASAVAEYEIRLTP